MEDFDHVHVVSDLHLGGEPGYQIFGQTRALAAFIDHVAAAPGRGALVINGDFVDFLACARPTPPRYLDVDGACAKLDLVVERFAPVFAALQRLVARDDKRLVVALGNHDVELALPEVQARLAAHLAAPPGRLTLWHDRDAWQCTVGGRRVWCAHGNEVDPWNVVPRDDLAALADARARGAPYEWRPNAGTRLVVDVMNPVKASYAWVDLLKPETVIVPGILYALPERPAANLSAFARVLARLAWDRGRRAAGFLSDEDAPDDDEALARLLREGGYDAPARSGDAWLAQAADDFARGARAEEFVPDDDGTLGAWDDLRFAADVAVGVDDGPERLRRALGRYLAGDDTFRHDADDDTARAVDQLAPEEADVVVAGHTHLHRMLPRRHGGGVYFNSGTWIRLMRLTPEQLATPAAFAPVYAALTTKRPGGGVAALDEGGYVMNRNSVVSVERAADGAVLASLRCVHEEGRLDPFGRLWDVVAERRFPPAGVSP
ncbi:MAG: metallophosphoesterase [Polyangiales bacterium]